MERSTLINSFFNELQKLNSKNSFLLKKDEIYVNTFELWNLKLPQNCEIVLGKNQEEIKKHSFRMIIITDEMIIFISGKEKIH